MKSLFLIALSGFLLLGTGIAQDQSGVIEVTGYSSLKVAPDQVVFNLTITANSSNFTETLDELNKQVNKLNETLLKAGIEKSDIRTLNYNIRENFEYVNGKRVLKGHKATQGVEVKVEFDQNSMKQVYSAIKESEIEVAMGISFRIADQEKYKPELITLAVEDAKLKARILAGAGGVQLGGIKKISYGLTQMQRPMMNYSMDGVSVKSNSESNLSVNPGSLKLSEQVIIVFYIDQEK